ncbi:citrate/2-methylcitrate synthase [Fodinicola acaciae]|uniref:citrate/2-methylcitrate synthase n=1 Tax=Fodinicola acaciae TaxID=2681555 RepID=UPI0013D59677|nr:citrate/2-methylcitrate synthase [Fodinicola acaciae]
MSLVSDPVTPIEVPRGLKNVVVTETQLGDVRGGEGFYHYRQYSAIELAERKSLEDVWYLFTYGQLPDSRQLAEFRTTVAPLRRLPDEVRSVLRSIALAGATFQPLAGLRTALSLIGAARGLKPVYDLDPAQRQADALLVSAVTPTVLAALYRIRQGQEPVEPREDLSAAANWLYMVSAAVPDDRKVEAIERYLVSTVDHGFNASTFTARVVASTGADVVAAVAAAIGSFSGPLHGGAPDRALEALDAIGTPERTDAWVRAEILAGRRIMGFGHPVYQTEDPRARMLRGIAQDLGGELVDFAVQVERRVIAVLAELKPGRELPVNVEFYAGVVMELCGLPRSMFTPTFAASRVIGWCANILEQAADRKIIRPIARYAGPPAPQPVR